MAFDCAGQMLSITRISNSFCWTAIAKWNTHEISMRSNISFFHSLLLSIVQRGSYFLFFFFWINEKFSLFISVQYETFEFFGISLDWVNCIALHCIHTVMNRLFSQNNGQHTSLCSVFFRLITFQMIYTRPITFISRLEIVSRGMCVSWSNVLFIGSNRKCRPFDRSNIIFQSYLVYFLSKVCDY